jgi:hypothetical protein
MTSLNGGFARGLLVILLVGPLAGCEHDVPTEPAPLNTQLRIEAISPTELQGTVGDRVTPVPTVIVTNGVGGKPVAGAKVAFISVYRSQSGDADSLANHIILTDSRGYANAGSWKLGTVAGMHDVEARLVDEHYFRSDSGRVVAFAADARAAAAATLSIGAFSSDTVGLPGDELAAPEFVVEDRFGNSVSGVTIKFSVLSGGGSVAKSKDETSRFGSASPGTWKLGSQPGLNSIVASVPGLVSVTHSARALEVGACEWYDLVPQSVRLLSSGALALCEDGTFEMVTVESSDAFPSEFGARQIGKYTLAGTAIVLTFPAGTVESGTLVDDALFFVHNNPNWVNYPLEVWRFFKRGASNGPRGVPFLVSGALTPKHQSVRVVQGGKPITDAEVTVNGVTIPHCCGDLYAGDLPEVVSPGVMLNLTVSVAGRIFVASGVVATAPIITAPISGSSAAVTDYVRVAWSSPTDPTIFDVCVNCLENALEGEITWVPGTSREFMIRPGALLDWGGGAVIAVYAKTRHFLNPAASPDFVSDVQFIARSRDVIIKMKP